MYRRIIYKGRSTAATDDQHGIDRRATHRAVRFVDLSELRRDLAPFLEQRYGTTNNDLRTFRLALACPFTEDRSKWRGSPATLIWGQFSTH
jgi:hypothetical protein